MFGFDNNTGYYADADFCNFVKETLEAAHRVVIEEVEMLFGTFEFRVKTAGIENQSIPFRWTPVAFGDGTVTFRMTMEEFEANYQKLEKKDLADALRASFTSIHQKNVELISIKEREDPMLDSEGYEMVVRLKPGKKYVNEPWLPLLWAKGDLMAFEAGNSELNEMIECLNERNRKHKS